MGEDPARRRAPALFRSIGSEISTPTRLLERAVVGKRDAGADPDLEGMRPPIRSAAVVAAMRPALEHRGRTRHRRSAPTARRPLAMVSRSRSPATRRPPPAGRVRRAPSTANARGLCPRARPAPAANAPDKSRRRAREPGHRPRRRTRRLGRARRPSSSATSSTSTSGPPGKPGAPSAAGSSAP